MWVPLFFPISQDGGFPAGSLVFATLEVGSHGFTACVAEMCERSVALAFTACQLGSRWVPLFFATWVALFFAVSQLRLHMLFAPLGNICCKNHGIHFQCCQNVRNPERVPLVSAACSLGSLWVPLFFATVQVGYMWVPLCFAASQLSAGFPVGQMSGQSAVLCAGVGGSEARATCARR